MLRDLLNLFFPPICESCKSVLSDNEIVLCTNCRHQLPVTNFHFENNNTVKKLLYGRVQLELATALFYFSKKGLVQQLLHNLKYRGHEHIGTCLGEWLGEELKTITVYNSIDIVIPVPLHQHKLKQRGYNQVSKFAKAIANALDAQLNETTLVKIKNETTQVFKNRIKRYDDAQTRFALSTDKGLKGKHILLVDDIITTGATIEACASLLTHIPDVTLSLATMAIAE